MVNTETIRTQPEQQGRTTALAKNIQSYVRLIDGKDRLSLDDERVFCGLRDELTTFSAGMQEPAGTNHHKNPELERLSDLRNSLEEGFLAHCLKIVEHVANKFTYNIEDLIAEGRLALVDASRQFDANKGRFSTIAVPRIRGAMIDFIRNGAYDNIPKGRRLLEKTKRINEAEDALFEKLKRKPTEEEIANELNISLSRLRNFRILQNQSQTPISLDQLSDEDGEDKPLSVLGQVKEDNSSEMETERIITLQRSFWTLIDDLTNEGRLSERKRTIIQMKCGSEPFNQPYTHKEIGQALQISESRVSQMVQNVLITIKKEAKARRLNEFL